MNKERIARIATAAIFTSAILVLGYIGFQAQIAFVNHLINERLAEGQSLGVALPGGIAVFETSLQNRISSTDTSMVLVSTSTRGGGHLSGYQCFTIDEGRTDAEYVCGILTSAKTVSSLERGLDPLTGTTSNSALKFAHRVGANVKITDFPLIQRLRNQASGAETYEGPLRYASGVTPASGGDLTDYEFVTGLAFNGAGVIDATNAAKGVVELATQIEAASSSVNGSSGVLVIPASSATSSYNSATAALRVLMTGNDGFLSQAFLPPTITKNFAVSGTITYTGGATAFASSSMIAYVASTTPSTTYTKPPNLKYIKLIAIGPGGKGGVGNNEGAGGGGGAHCVKVIPAAAIGSTETVVVGGGATQISTTFGSHITAASGANASVKTPGGGGTCTNADYGITGGTGGTGLNVTTILSGDGGSSAWGEGGKGAYNTSATGASDGAVGYGPGGGGGGNASATDGNPSANAATNGADGAIYVEQFFY